MATQADNTAQESKDFAANKEVTNKSADKAVENKETTNKNTNDETPTEKSSCTTTNTMTDGNETEETAKPKARFRKSNLFIDTEEANAFFNKKK
ncbi:hypothetical protein KCU92_g4784, partial [Aureobasidium melanogenum]